MYTVWTAVLACIPRTVRPVMFVSTFGPGAGLKLVLAFTLLYVSTLSINMKNSSYGGMIMCFTHERWRAISLLTNPAHVDGHHGTMQ